MALDNKQVQEVFVAGLLHAIGMVGFDDELLQTPVASMTPRQLEVFRKHPSRAEQLLMPLAELKSTVEIIAAQLERFDGSGYPQGIPGKHIALGARILTVASDYDSLQIGLLEQRHLGRQEALDLIRQRSGQRYDPAVVAAFLDIYRDLSKDALPATTATTRTVTSRELAVGMVLARDMTSPTGLLLLTAGHVLDEAVIRKITGFAHSIGSCLGATIWVGEPISDT
jgi:HD-GYP domain-containing protein (c-di-GMP phosphodiesterase class II)